MPRPAHRSDRRLGVLREADRRPGSCTPSDSCSSVEGRRCASAEAGSFSDRSRMPSVTPDMV